MFHQFATVNDVTVVVNIFCPHHGKVSGRHPVPVPALPLTVVALSRAQGPSDGAIGRVKGRLTG